MNMDLHVRNGALSTVPEIIEGFVVDQKIGQAISPYELPSLQQVLREVGPLPEEALFLGLAEDGLPILLNLWDPLPGPILVAGDSQSGKTGLLKTIARFAASTHRPGQLQYGVVTRQPHEWNGFADCPQCIGIFSTAQHSVSDFIHALAAWTRMDKTSRQSVLLLIDGLDDLLSANGGLGRDLQKILMHGPAKRIWPIVTLNLEHFQNVGPWLQYFHTRVFGYTRHADRIQDDAASSGFENLSKGMEFSLKEKSRWIKFWNPGS